LKSHPDPSNSQKLEMYSLYKQGLHGDNTAPQPSSWNFEAWHKWQAWEALKGTDQAEAQQKYIDNVMKIVAELPSDLRIPEKEEFLAVMTKQASKDDSPVVLPGEHMVQEQQDNEHQDPTQEKVSSIGERGEERRKIRVSHGDGAAVEGHRLVVMMRRDFEPKKLIILSQHINDLWVRVLKLWEVHNNAKPKRNFITALWDYLFLLWPVVCLAVYHVLRGKRL